MEKRGYGTDLNESEWEVIRGFFEKDDPRGRKPKYPRRDIVNAILYVVKSGCEWRMLPNDYPHWNTVYRHFQMWNARGVWDEALGHLNEQARLRLGKKNEPKLRYRRFTKPQEPERFRIVWD